ncbi:MAG: hypothetical protein IJ217_04825 [Clostridia bacterium]|nr:hypothetical protein [Clostridia bacterium]
MLAAIVIFQFSFFGLRYFNVVDDNNQLGIFHLLNDNISENVIHRYQSYNVRPLAFISDAYIFQLFWNHMYLLLAIILVLHVCNLFFIDKIGEKIGIHLNAFCLALFGLAPILVESLYWISASTRIVFSMFLCLASIYLLLQYFDEENKTKRIAFLAGAILLNLLCVGYYEQTVALNLFLFVFVLILLKKYKYLWIPVVSTTWIGIWYIYFMANGQMQSRGALNLKGIFGNGIQLIKNVHIIYKNGWSNFIYSLGFGGDSILSTPLSILLFALIAGFIYYIYKNKFAMDQNSSVWKKLALGAIIFVVPLLPFLILETGAIYVRNMYFSTLGLAIIIGTLLDLILKLVKNETVCNIIKTALILIFTVPFVISNLDGANNYRKVNALDNKVASQIIENVDSNIFEEKKSIAIYYDVDSLPKYKNLSNYVESTIESDWATAGKLQVMRQNPGIGSIYINSNEEIADVTVYFDENMDLISVIYHN